ERHQGVDAAKHETVEDLLQQDVEIEQVAQSPRSPRSCRLRSVTVAAATNSLPRAQREEWGMLPIRDAGARRGVAAVRRALRAKKCPGRTGANQPGRKNFDGWKRRLTATAPSGAAECIHCIGRSEERRVGKRVDLGGSGSSRKRTAAESN